MVPMKNLLILFVSFAATFAAISTFRFIKEWKTTPSVSHTPVDPRIRDLEVRLILLDGELINANAAKDSEDGSRIVMEIQRIKREIAARLAVSRRGP